MDRFARALGVGGLSVTAPFKLEALHAANAAGRGPPDRGANTLKRRADGGWDARNTDVEGFLAPLADERLDRLAARRCLALVARRVRPSLACVERECE